MSKERKYVNGLPLLIMLSINSRTPEKEPFDSDYDGATIFEIENDMEDASGLRPQQGTIDSAMGLLRDRGYVERDLVPIGHFQTYVYTLTETGKCRARWFMGCLDKIRVFKPRTVRGERISSPKRKRPRKKYDTPSGSSG